MSFFITNKPKIKVESTDDSVRFNIEYFKLKDSDDFKLRLLKEIIDSKVCMAVINTKLMFNPKGLDYGESIGKLTCELDRLNIKYKKIIVKSAKNITIFGVSVSKNEEKKQEDYVVGFLIDASLLQDIKPQLFSYNPQYFIDCNDSADELFQKFEADCEDTGELRKNFKYHIFDNSYMGQMTINTKKEDSKLIHHVIENI